MGLGEQCGSQLKYQHLKEREKEHGDNLLHHTTRKDHGGHCLYSGAAWGGTFRT